MQNCEKELKQHEAAHKALLAKPPSYLSELAQTVGELEKQLEALGATE